MTGCDEPNPLQPSACLPNSLQGPLSTSQHQPPTNAFGSWFCCLPTNRLLRGPTPPTGQGEDFSTDYLLDLPSVSRSYPHLHPLTPDFGRSDLAREIKVFSLVIEFWIEKALAPKSDATPAAAQTARAHSSGNATTLHLETHCWASFETRSVYSLLQMYTTLLPSLPKYPCLPPARAVPCRARARAPDQQKARAIARFGSRPRCR